MSNTNNTFNSMRPNMKEAYADEELKRKALMDLIKGDQAKRQEQYANMNLAAVPAPTPDRTLAYNMPEEQAVANLDEALQGGREEIALNRKKFKNIFGQL